MDPMKVDSFLNITDMNSDKASVAMTTTILTAIQITEMENKTQSVQMVSTTSNVLEFFSAIPPHNSAAPDGAKLAKDEVIELFGCDGVVSEIYDYVAEKYPGISVTKAPGRTGVFFFCPRLVMLVHEYQSNELSSLAEQLSKPLN